MYIIISCLIWMTLNGLEYFLGYQKKKLICKDKLSLFLLIWQSPGLAGLRKVDLIIVTRRPHHPSIAAGLYCLTTSPGFLPALYEKWSWFFYMNGVLLSYTRDWRLKVSSERLGNEDKAPCPRVLLQGRGLNRGPPVWKSEVLTARPKQLLYFVRT